LIDAMLNGCAATLDGFAAEKRSLLDPTILKAAEAGRKVSVSAYQCAMEQRLKITAASRAFFNRFDLLVCPVLPTVAWSMEYDAPEGFSGEDWRWCPYTFPWNMTGQPAASVPIGVTSEGLPVGVQIVGPWGARKMYCARPLRSSDADIHSFVAQLCCDMVAFERGEIGHELTIKCCGRTVYPRMTISVFRHDHGACEL
jgi:hypothetical protein